MRYTIQSKVIDEKNKRHISYGVTTHNSDKELTVGELKQIFKNKIPDSEKLDIKEEILYFGNDVLSGQTETVKPKSGFEYNIILK